MAEAPGRRPGRRLVTRASLGAGGWPTGAPHDTGDATGELHAQEGGPGPWHERLAHFRVEFTPSSGDELQSEYFVPATLPRDRLARPAHAGSPGRAGGAEQRDPHRRGRRPLDEPGPRARQGRLPLHLAADAAAVAAVLPAVEAVLAPYAARPHWAKVSTVPAQEVPRLYRRYDDFAALLGRRDPGGKFRNDLVDRFFPR